MTRARALIVWAAAALVADSCATGPLERCLLILIELNVILATRRDDAAVRRPLRMAAIASAVAIALVTAESHTGDHVMFALSPAVPLIGGPWTLEAAAYGAALAAGLAAAMLSVTPLVTALTPDELIDSLPPGAERIGATLGITLTLLPRLMSSVTAIRECTLIRSGGSGSRLRWRGVMAPALLTAIEDSVQLAEAMEARGYGGPATRGAIPHPGRGSRESMVVTAAAISAGAMVLLTLIHPVSGWAPFPALTFPAVDPLRVTALVPLLTALVVPRA